MAELPTHLKRVLSEKLTLDARLERLNNYIAVYADLTLARDELELLQQQVYHMQQYSQILKKRIDAYTHKMSPQ